MAIEMSAGETDDPGFIEVLNSIVGGLIADHAPKQFWIVQIDNWFDQKWLRFSGMGLVASDIPLDRYDTVKAESYQEKLTFPAFTPNRVLGQFSFVRAGSGYTESALPALPHSHERKHSDENLRRRIQDFTRSGCFVWYSANTVANGRGSVMVYVATADHVECWFAGFNRQQEWKLDTAKGVNRDTLERWLKNPPDNT
ncbi:MAG: hypothetical protein JO065_13875 [Acidobacteria bacterium]|nr:hypothetical protein [Acidobacteriota bacterium]